MVSKNLSFTGQRITAFYVGGEVLSRVQDNPISSAITMAVGTAPKNAAAVAGVLDDVRNGRQADTARFGLPIIASASGSRVELPAVNLSGQSLGAWDRLSNTVSLHFMDYVLKSLDTQMQSNGALNPALLKNVR